MLSVIGIAAASVAMWPYLVSAIFTLKNISGSWKDLALSMAVTISCTVLLWVAIGRSPPDHFDFLELLEVEWILVLVMMSVPHFLMDGLGE
jgi:hypothetical protein